MTASKFLAALSAAALPLLVTCSTLRAAQVPAHDDHHPDHAARDRKAGAHDADDHGADDFDAGDPAGRGRDDADGTGDHAARGLDGGDRGAGDRDALDDRVADHDGTDDHVPRDARHAHDAPDTREARGAGDARSGRDARADRDAYDVLGAHAGHDAHDAAGPASPVEPLGLSLTRGWTDRWVHSDFSPRGTPFVHLFGLEPAFLDRDLFVDYAFTATEEGDESELAVELEYALTRRLGVVVEAPLVSLNPDDGETEFGLGDAALAPRALLVETDRFLLSCNLEVAFPTGSESRGLGSGEVAIGPSISTWLDLGNWVTLSTQVGTEHGTESGDSELSYAAALAWSFRGPALFPGHADAHGSHAAHSHFPPGLTSLILEYTGRTALSGEEADRSTGEVLFGLSHVLTESLEVRGAYQLPVGGTHDIDYGYVLSVIYHF